MRICLGLLWTGILLAALPASAATNYVAIHTGGTYDGAGWATAYTNIQTAINASVDNDFIFIKQGTYANNGAQIVIDGKDLIIRGGYEGSGSPGTCVNDATLTVVNAQALSRVLYIANCSTGLLENLTFRNGRTIGGMGASSGISMSATAITFVNCIIEDNNGRSGAGVHMSTSTVLFDRCRIQNNITTQESSGGGIYQNGGVLTLLSCVLRGNANSRHQGGALYVYGGQTRLFNCLVQNNATSENAYNTGAIYSIHGTVKIENCTVEGNSPAGIYRAASIYGSGTVVSNSIVWNNGDDIFGAVTLSYCNIQDGDSNGVNGNISSDPLFISGYYLATNSPCIDAGSDLSANLGLDGKYTETNSTDSGVVDLGYHHAAAFSPAKPNLYVLPIGGSDLNDGSSAFPFRTITYALSVAEVGARIHLAAGSYTNGAETFPLNFSTDAVQLLGTNAKTTVIDATGAGKRVMTVTGVGGGARISNVTLRGGNANINGAGLYVDRSAILVVDCVIRNNNGKYGGGVAIAGGASTLKRCEILENTTITESYGGGVCGLHGLLTMRSCVIARNKSQRTTPCGGAMRFISSMGAVEIYNSVIISNSVTPAQSGTVGGIAAGGSSLLLENVTLADNIRPGYVDTGLERFAGTVTVKNSILWGNGIDSKGTVTISYSCIENSSDYTDGGGNTNADPVFVDHAYYHLQSKGGHYAGGYFSGGSWANSKTHSPLIDAGDPAGDWSLEPDPNGGRVNMGCYGNSPVASKSWKPMGTLIILF